MIVLIIEDNMVLNSVGRMLIRLGYTVISYQSPDRALEFVYQNSDIVKMAIVDWEYPDARVQQLTIQLHRLKSDLRILVYVDHLEEKQITDAMRLRNVEYRRKPYLFGDIVYFLNQERRNHELELQNA